MAASSFPEFITARRRELDLTLGDVANSLGVSPITVSNWSNGDSTPNAENLEALAGLLGVAPDRLAKMAGVTLQPSSGAAVNLMPSAASGTGQLQDAAAGAGTVPPPPAETAASDRAAPVGEARIADEVPIPPVEVDPPAETAASDRAAPVGEAGVADEVPIPPVEVDPPAPRQVAPDAMDSELAELVEETAPAPSEARDSVPAFVSQPPPAPEPAVAASPPKPPVRRPRPRSPEPEREVVTLPLTYIEDPRQLMRYRIRWALTVVVLLVMFVILLWASRELISALAEIKESVTPGGG